MKRRLLLAAFTIFGLLAAPAALFAAPLTTNAGESFVFDSAGAFSSGELTNLQLDGDIAVLGADPTFQSTSYAPYTFFGFFQSAELILKQPANSLTVSASTRTPDGSAVQLAVRASRDGLKWTSWQDADSGRAVALQFTAARVQVKATLLSNSSVVRPSLLKLRVSTRLDPDIPQRAILEDAGGGKAPVYRVYATREGLVGARTANGHIIQPNDRFVALPSLSALCGKDGGEYQVLISYKGKRTILPVWDVGPWNIHDDYWDPDRQMWRDLPVGTPEAQAAYFAGYNNGKDERGRKVKIPSGIDIADGAFIQDLGMTQSDWVDVTFLWMGDLPQELEVAGDQTMPTDRVSAIINNPDVQYFPATGHNLGYEFLDFWQSHDGMRLFGLPITDGVQVGNVTAQYFERARFEYHPDLPDGQRVVIGELGSSLTAGNEFDKAAPFADSPTQRFFPDTEHSLSNGFLYFWNSHDGAELFGSPISEELGFTDPETGNHLVVQYFERARLEFHPELQGTPYEVELGLLGKEFLQRKGWLE
jgi:hypothetical protein